MNRRNVQLVILCEDGQQECFLRRFLKKCGHGRRELRVVKAPPGRGAADKFVRKHFPTELRAWRTQRGHVSQTVVVMIDGDKLGVRGRLIDLDQDCRAAGVETRQPGDRVAVFVPTWCIETWFAYLDGNVVDEDRSDYPRLARERDCQRHVDTLAAMCERGELRAPPPRSLVAACDEFKSRLR
ncbi:MAG: hypothetical protein HY897_02615 [Deltaproteobacteria bacterium]|nr:hypothetical protein [Deltaproteobacteria bacterium]